MSEPMRCANGHEILPADTFCGLCGSTAQQPPAPPARECPAGHENPADFDYCGTCGAAIVFTGDPGPEAENLDHDAAADAHALVRSSTERSTKWIWAGVGIAALVIAAIVVAANGGSDGDAAAEDDDATYEEVTTTTLISDLCIEELSQWMPYVSGEGSLMDAMAEFGSQAPETTIIRNANSLFMRQLYQVGRDDASAASYELLAQECIALGDAYEPGHLPPG